MIKNFIYVFILAIAMYLWVFYVELEPNPIMWDKGVRSGASFVFIVFAIAIIKRKYIKNVFE